MRRAILPALAGLVLGACASGADVAEEDDASRDSAVLETLEGIPPQTPAESRDAQP